MNLKYVEPTGHDYPKQLDERIHASSNGTSACCTFNRRGTLLAIGCREGHINIWDFETRSIAKQLCTHTGIVTSVSWSRNGNKLLSSDWNGLLLLWDIITNKVLIKIEFENRPIEHSWLHGRSTKLAIIHLHECEPLIIMFKNKKNPSNNHQQIITIDKQKIKPIKITNHSYDKYEIETKCIHLSDFSNIYNKLSHKLNHNNNKKKSIRKPPRITCGVFDKFAENIYCGTSHGRLLIINYCKWCIISNDKITNSQQQIKSIVFSRCGNYIVLNCGDRIIRYIDIIRNENNNNNIKIKIKKQYQDAVERKNWNACCFSSNGEYICAAMEASQECIIYIWQRCYERSLEKVLKSDMVSSGHGHGARGNTTPAGVVVDMVWHPILPILVSVSQCGQIQIWNQTELTNGHNWSTFDANFKVLTKNIWAAEMKKKKKKKKNILNFNESESENDEMNLNEIECESESEIDENGWLKQQLSNIESKEALIDKEEMIEIDIFKESNGNFDRFSGDEFENDLLNPIRDSLQNELIHLPIQINCPFDSNQISQYLNNIKECTNQYHEMEYVNNNNNNKQMNKIKNENENKEEVIIQHKTEIKQQAIAIKPAIKISNKNEKVLQNLTKHLTRQTTSHHSHHIHHGHGHSHSHSHSHHLNMKKMRKKKNKKHKINKKQLQMNNNNQNNNNTINNKQLQLHSHSINPFKSFNTTNNNYNTLKMNASNVHKKRGFVNLNNNNNNNNISTSNNNATTNEPPKKKQKMSH